MRRPATNDLTPPPARSTERFLQTLEQLLLLPALDIKATLARASDLVASATGCDKVDLFLYDRTRDSLVAVGVSSQPLSALQRKLGLDVLQLSNGGRAVEVFRDGQTYLAGRVDEDPGELKGIRERLGVRSELGVPLDVAGARRGVLFLASLRHDFFTPEDASFAESVAGWIGSVTHRAELNEQISNNALEQGRKAAAEEIVTVLAHDLRNYLGPLEMRHYMLRVRAERDGRAEDLEDLGVAERAVGHLKGMVVDILDVARLDQGIFSMTVQPVELAPLLREIAAALTTPRAPVRVSLQADAPLVVAADAARLRQCIDNLIANAIQKSPAGAEVAVLLRNETREAGEWARIEVIDQGPGIPEEVLPHIFERFRRGAPGEGGLGLGLYLAQRIASLHGGALSVDSTPGKGARFCLFLPCESAAGPRA